MRLFTAIVLDDQNKRELYDTAMRLKGLARGGSFTEKENLHLTVNFIGETKRLDEVKEAMQHAVRKTKAKPFMLTLQGFGRFKREEGDIYWVGVLEDNTLWRIQKELVSDLKEAGFFDIDDREYKPHLTLGRRVRFDKNFDIAEFGAGIAPKQMQVRKLSLMQSERIEGKLTYTEIYHVAF